MLLAVGGNDHNRKGRANHMSSACVFVPRTNLPLTVTPLYGIGHQAVVPNVCLGVLSIKGALVNACWGAEPLHTNQNGWRRGWR